MKIVVLLACLLLVAPASGQDWPHWGRDAGGTHYSPLDEITPANVGELEELWTWNHGDVSDGSAPFGTTSAFELTPLFVDDTLFGCTPFHRVFALDPRTGTPRWIFDPEIDVHARWANQLACRGVATWVDSTRAEGEACRRRILTNTLDARLIALDAATGARCADFGTNGEVDLNPGVGEQRWKGEYSLTSAPTIAGDLVVVGSAVGDNVRVHAPSGVIRAFDPRTGEMRWAWDLAPTKGAGGARDPESGWMLSTPNVWAPMSYDAERDLLFVPTGNPTPDYASAHREGLDEFGSSVVALEGRTGRVVWSFQTVHHDVWDLDVPAQPTLFTMRRGNERIPALVQPTKMGTFFVFDRRDGTPLHPIEERPVPQSGPEGMVLSKTQPVPTRPPPLIAMSVGPDDAWGLTPWDRGACRRRIEELHFEGAYTPPTVQGSLMIPGNSGGSNWGGVALHPERQILVANVMHLPWAVTLIPRDAFAAERAANPGVEYGPQEGTPHGIRREILQSPIGLPCTAPPYGSLHGIDIARGEILWSRDIGEIPFLGLDLGLPNIGGPLVTGGGLIFLGATVDTYFRAFDLGSGEELWKTRLPAGGNAVPMTFRVDGRQIVVVAAGGYGRAPGVLGDALVAFALPEDARPPAP